jgi:hypothetical protein
MHPLHEAVSYAVKAVEHGGSSNSIPLQVGIPIAAAVVGAACSYVFTRLNARHDPKRELSWEASTDRGLLAVSSDIRDNVSVSYKGESVSDLVAVRCRVSNTGNQVIKNEVLRFAFPEGTKILEANFAPQPERELRASQVESNELESYERSFCIGHLEAGQEVSFEFIAAGMNAEDWKVHSFNEEGGVAFRQREVNRITDEQEHVRPFVAIVILFFIVSTFTQAIEATGVFINEFVAAIGLLIDMALFIALTPHVIPITRIAQRLIARWLLKPDPTTNVTVLGGGARFVASSGSVGSVAFQADTDD